ncbi:hypothetical protein [Puniceicoccus vermicola]|uniref:Uncharacterized protein n=1 Tax=Puniceicoccus vermicola TaxID=388746 RepID=A0A7X1B1F8_9BACT|nr:hypothetical protein [Puniceicoccus vermicola]MBC2603856.1 hypothetical protein [Puniceicoccus vermicola]
MSGKILHLLFGILGMHVLFIGYAFAESPVPPVNAQLRFSIWNDGFNLRDSVESEPSKNAEIFWCVSGEEIFPVRAALGDFGPKFEYRGSQTLRMYSTRPPSTGAFPNPVAECRILPSTKEAVVILFPQNDEKGRQYESLVIDQSSTFKQGEVYLQSLYPKTLYLRLNQERLVLEPFKNASFSLDDSNSRGVRLQVVVRDESSDRVRPLIHRFIRMNPEGRVFVFILPHPMRVDAAELRLLEASLDAENP